MRAFFAWLRGWFVREPYGFFPKRDTPEMCPRVGCFLTVAVRVYDGSVYCPEHGVMWGDFAGFIAEELTFLPDSPDREP